GTATGPGRGCSVKHDNRGRTDDHPVLASTVVTGPLRVLIRATGVRVGRMRLRSGSPTAIRITGDNHGGAGWCGATGAVSGRVRRQPCRDRCPIAARSEEHTSELQSRENLVCRLLLAK